MWPYCDSPQSGVRFQHCDAPYNRHSGASRNLRLPAPLHPTAVIPAQAGIYACRLHYTLQPSFRRKPESICNARRDAACYRPYSRHSGPSRNLCLPAPLHPTTAIPAQAGIYACRLHYTLQPSFRRKPESICNARRDAACYHPLQPSFRRKPESICNARRDTACYRPLQPSFRRQPESICNARRDAACYHPLQPSFRRKPESICNARRDAACYRPLQPSFRRQPESMLADSITVVGDYDAGFRLFAGMTVNMTTPPSPTSAGVGATASPFHPIPKIAPPK